MRDYYKNKQCSVQHPSVHLSATGCPACGTLKCKQGEVIVPILGVETIFFQQTYFHMVLILFINLFLSVTQALIRLTLTHNGLEESVNNK